MTLRTLLRGIATLNGIILGSQIVLAIHLANNDDLGRLVPICACVIAANIGIFVLQTLYIWGRTR